VTNGVFNWKRFTQASMLYFLSLAFGLYAPPCFHSFTKTELTLRVFGWGIPNF